MLRFVGLCILCNYYFKKRGINLTTVSHSVIVIRLKTKKNPKNRNFWGCITYWFYWIIGCGGRIWTYDLQVMSLTSYRAAPPRVMLNKICEARRPGNVLLSHTLRCSTISATELHVRVRNGIGWYICTIITRPFSLTN